MSIKKIVVSLFTVLLVPVLLSNCYYYRLNKIKVEGEVTADQKKKKEDKGNGASLSDTETSVHLTEFDLEMTEKPGALQLQPDDVIRLLVVQHPELTSDLTIQRDGYVTVPVAGTVYASGKTVEQVRDEIRMMIAEKNVQDSIMVLNAGDMVRMLVWLHPELTHQSLVQNNGKLYLPLVGEVAAVGRTIESIEAEMAEKLVEFINTPKVSILPVKVGSPNIQPENISVLPIKLKERAFSIVGDVDAPGRYPINGCVQVMEAMSMARYRRSAALDHILVIRNSQTDKPVYRRLELKQYMIGANPKQNIYLKNGDIVVVSPTPIHEVGVFVDNLFTKTMPVLGWWNAAWQARYANEMYKTSVRVNEIIYRYYKAQDDR